MNTSIIPESTNHWLSLRKDVLTSTEIPALFSASKYVTKFELHFKKLNKTDSDYVDNDRVVWGTRLENSIAEGLAIDNKWNIRKVKEFIFNKNTRIGSSFDYMILDDNLKDYALLEIKNVDGLIFKNEWSVHDELDIEPPLYIELQLQHQMHISGVHLGFFGVLIGGNKTAVIRREYNSQIGSLIDKLAKEFWYNVDNNITPSPDFHKDAEFIKSLYQNVHGHKVIEADSSIDQLAEKYKIISEKIKELEENKEATKAELLTLIRDAEKVKGNGYTISAGITAESQVSFTRKSFRNFRINYTKQKDNQ